MPNPPDENEKVEALLALSYKLFPDPVDVFEDRLAEMLGYRRHPAIPYPEWRRVRGTLIEADPRADEMAELVEAELLIEIWARFLRKTTNILALPGSLFRRRRGQVLAPEDGGEVGPSDFEVGIQPHRLLVAGHRLLHHL